MTDTATIEHEPLSEKIRGQKSMTATHLKSQEETALVVYGFGCRFRVKE